MNDVSVNPVVYSDNLKWAESLRIELNALDERLKKVEKWAAENRAMLEKFDAYLAERLKMEADGR